MPNIRDARSAALTGMARAAEWAEEFKAAWHAPDDEAKLITWWMGIPADQKAMMRELNPADCAKFDAFINQLKEKYRWQQ